MNFGMKISQEGVDVKTGTDDEMVLTSKYSIFKGSLKGSGTTSVKRDGTTTTITIPHGLGYAPMVQAMVSDKNSIYFSSSNYITGPRYDFDGSTEFSFQVKSDSTNAYLTFDFNDLSDQIFGYPVQGSTNYVFGDETPAIAFITETYIANAGDVLESVSFYAKERDNAETIEVGVYRIQSGLPTTRIASGSVNVNDTTMQIWTVSMGSVALTAGYEYGVAIGGWGGNQSAGEYNTTVPMDSFATNQISFREATEQSLPTMWDHDSYGILIPSVWATVSRGAIDLDYSYTIFIDKANIN